MSQSDLRLSFGLGPATQVDAIEVKWPIVQKDVESYAKTMKISIEAAEKKLSGKVERFTNIAANQFLTIKEGEGIIKRQPPHTKS